MDNPLVKRSFLWSNKIQCFLVNTGISKQILSNRLKHLIELEIFELSIYKEIGVRERKEYLLTKKVKA